MADGIQVADKPTICPFCFLTFCTSLTDPTKLEPYLLQMRRECHQLFDACVRAITSQDYPQLLRSEVPALLRANARRCPDRHADTTRAERETVLQDDSRILIETYATPVFRGLVAALEAGDANAVSPVWQSAQAFRRKTSRMANVSRPALPFRCPENG